MLTLVVPVVCSAVASVSEPMPACSTLPLPETAWFSVTASLRCRRSRPASSTAPLPSEPLLPSAPTCSVPAAICVLPV